MPVASGHQRTEAAKALLTAIGTWSLWCHRRIDSVTPLEGERGVQQHSIDCTPPLELEGLKYPISSNKPARFSRLLLPGWTKTGEKLDSTTAPQIMVPLAALRKDRLRQFDVTSGGKTVPVLGSLESNDLVEEMLVLFLERSGVEITSAVRDAVAELVGPNSPSDQTRGFTSSGMWKGKPLISPETLKIDGFRWFLEKFRDNFLLVGLLPGSAAGRRQLIKFSFHWRNEPSKSRFRFLRGVFGPSTVEYTITPIEPAEASSYHLEFQTPYELECVKLRIPEGDNRPGENNRSWIDETANPVAHVHQSYASANEDLAKVELRLPGRGLRYVALASVLTATVILGLALFLPNATENLLRNDGGSATLLVTVPAAFIGFFVVSARESALVAEFRKPLLRHMLFSAWTLLAMAGSIAGDMIRDYIPYLWGASFALNLVMLGGIARPLLKKKNVTGE